MSAAFASHINSTRAQQLKQEEDRARRREGRGKTGAKKYCRISSTRSSRHQRSGAALGEGGREAVTDGVTGSLTVYPGSVDHLRDAAAAAATVAHREILLRMLK